MLTVTSSTLVKNSVSNNEMTSSIVISRRLAEVSCVGLKGFWPGSAGKATPMVIHTKQQASGSHFRSIIEVTGIELFESKMNCEKYGKAKTCCVESRNRCESRKPLALFGKVE
jgi:hypothetical protein